VSFVHIFFQFFYANFIMQIAKERTTISLGEDGDDDLLFSKHIISFPVSAFIQDTKDLVNTRVKAEISQILKTGNAKEKAWAKTRYDALKAWSQSETPLTWRNGDNLSENYARLSIITNKNNLSDQNRVSQAQLATSPTSMSHHDLAKLCIKMLSSRRVSAPICKDGQFIQILQIAINLIHSRCSNWNNVNTLIEQVLAKKFKEMNVDFIPWHIESQNPRSHYIVVQYDYWLILKNAPPHTNQNNMVLLSPLDSANSMAAHVSAQNSHSSWNLPRSLHEMDSLWNKNVLPNEWAICHASLNSIKDKQDADVIIQTYQYVKDNFSGHNNWVHGMAIIWGILFSRVAPFICHSKEDIEFDHKNNPKVITQNIRDLPWIEPSSTKKGVTDNLPLLTMMVTAIIAYLDDKSPMSIYLIKKNFIQGDTWTNKHGICFNV
jgi:hypothetical protein